MKSTILPTLLITALSAGAVAAGHLARSGSSPWSSEGRPSGPTSEGGMASPASDRSVEAPTTTVPTPGERPRIDVVFALDTTGSMGGLLEGAKRKIWSLADQIVSGQPRPDVRIGLVAYRDRSDAYVTRVTPLTRDIDGVHAALLGLSAHGGGDGPEDVNAALSGALADDMGWDEGEQVVRLLFLVGDAPPHDDYDGPKSWELAAAARARGIVVNTLRCGGSGTTEAAWRRIASAGGGDFATVPQDGGVIVQTTPYDDELADLNRALADTVIDYGSEEDRRASRSKRHRRSSLGGAIGASAAAYNAKAGRMNDEDLLTQLASGKVELDGLETEALPEEMRALSKEEQKRRIERVREKRAVITDRILEVAERRDAYLAKERKTAEKKSALDDRMMRSVKKAAAEAGVSYAE